MLELIKDCIRIEENLKDNKVVYIQNMNYTLTLNLVNILVSKMKKNAVLVVPDYTYSDTVKTNIESFPVFTFNFDDDSDTEKVFPYDTSGLLSYYKHEGNSVLVCDCLSFFAKLPAAEFFTEKLLNIECGSTFDMTKVIEILFNNGYEREEITEVSGSFSVRGSLIDVFPVNTKHPYRIDFFGDEISSIRKFDCVTQKSIEEVKSIKVMPCQLKLDNLNLTSNIAEYITRDPIVVIYEDKIIENMIEKADYNVIDLLDYNLKDNLTAEIDNTIVYTSLLSPVTDKEPGYRYTVIQPKTKTTVMLESKEKNMLLTAVRDYINNRYKIVLSVNYAEQADRLKKLFENENISFTDCKYENITGDFGENDVIITVSNFEEPFIIDDRKILFLPETAISKPKYFKRKTVFTRYRSETIESFSDLNPEDYVVHVEYGIGIYKGVETLDIQGKKQDFVLIKYADDGQLYLPMEQVNMVQKYLTGDTEEKPALYKLGGSAWQKVKLKAKKKITELAEELVKLYALRKTKEGFIFKEDTPWQLDFEASFSYRETPDQLKAIQEVKDDMESKKIMDRLICGDVGYGKTEVAIRAAFKCVMDSKQAAVLVPTTVLSEQHYKTFTERLKNYPFKTEVLSRFKDRKEQKKIIYRLKTGETDIIIGTHRLLQKDIEFYDLGLLIVDEEQRFGVRHKEKIKQMKKSVDVLSMTATPIPRTLHMSLMGIRDISIINTPPPERKAIKTFVLKTEKSVIRDAVLREIERNGQVYFVHNRVATIDIVASNLQKLVPEAKIAVAHGKLKPADLERVMFDFYNGKYDVLVCTTIIENGLDIQNVNTIIVNKSDMFGLSQLYQLRGRIGRSERKAYAYLLHKGESTMSEVVRKRLSIIGQNAELGSGFKIAMHDLEIRGAGNILGAEQSGLILEIGYELYSRLLKEALAEMQGQSIEEEKDCRIIFDRDAYIPDEYIENPKLKINFYKKLRRITNTDEVDYIRDELEDRFGKIPEETNLLLKAAKLRTKLVKKDVSEVIFSESLIKMGFNQPDSNALLELSKNRVDISFSKKYNKGILIKVSPNKGIEDRINKVESIIEVI